MKISKHHYSRYLISVQFDNNFTPDSIEAMLGHCVEFLEDLGMLASKSGERLHATYSVVSGLNGYHAHFAVSWLPIVLKRIKTAKMGNQPIARHAIIKLLEENLFYVDNPREAIKKITHDRKFVTEYVTIQPKNEQSVCGSGFYIHEDFRPYASEIKMGFYCSKQQFIHIEKLNKKNNKNALSKYFLFSAAYLILISSILLSLF